MLAVVVGVAVLGAAAFFLTGGGSAALVELASEPRAIYATNPFEVGASYTLGAMAIPSDVPRPVTVSGVSIVHASGVETIGVGVFDAEAHAAGIGLVPG